MDALDTEEKKFFETRVNKLKVTVESLVESNAKIQSTLELLLEKFEGKVISPMRTPEDTFLQDETLNASTPEGTADMQFEPLTEEKRYACGSKKTDNVGQCVGSRSS